MSVSRRAVIGYPVLAAGSALWLAACSDDTSSGGDQTPGPTGSMGAGSSDWQSFSGSMMGHSVTVGVAPLVRMDDSTTMLPLKITRSADDGNTGAFDISEVWSRFEPNQPLSLVRVIDAGGLRLWDPINEASIDEELRGLQPGNELVRGVVFGAVDAAQVTVSLPMIGFPVVNVVEKAEAESALGLDLASLFEGIEVAEKGGGQDSAGDPRAPLNVEVFTRSLDTSTQSRTTTATVTTILSSDVTFEFGKYDLTAQADAQLQIVADQIASYSGGGDMSIVGHTDDVADEAFNQTLSEQRAAAVHKRLGELTDLSSWTVSEEGKGETEPAVEGDDEAARAINRRVVVTLTPDGGTEAASSASASPSAAKSGGSLPEAKGPVGKGPDGVTVNSIDGQSSVTISLEKVARRGKYLFGVAQVSGVPGADGPALTDWLSDSSAGLFEDSRSEDSAGAFLPKGANGLDLIAGDRRYSPCDYVPLGAERHSTLAELRVEGSLSGNTGICVIWPDMGQDSVILDRAPAAGVASGSVVDLPWRLTDIPVVDE